MGRHKKTVIDNEGLDRRVNGYYSTPKFIADFISSAMLKINPDGLKVLDPCVGKEELLDKLYEERKKIDSFDIVDYGGHHKSNFVITDFLEYYRSMCEKDIFSRSPSLDYDYFIANPPYNCHEVDYIRKNKSKLNLIFPDVGVLNMYSMFLSALINVAKEGAIIGVITNDSFLTARLHYNLRRQIIKNCAIHCLILCPNDLFWSQKADVRTCIIILQKGNNFQKEVRVLNRPANSDELKQKLHNNELETALLDEIVLQGRDDRNEFVVGCPKDILSLFRLPRLGSLFRCVTGISTGNDKKYVSSQKTEYFSIPFYKNPANRKFCTTPDGFMPNDFLDIDKEVKNFMVRNKDILFKEGITCSSMGIPFSACYLPPNATFGVNANIICEYNDIWWLLSYLNSSLVTFFVRGILLRTNMITSGYVSRIPIIDICEKSKEELSKISMYAYKNKIDSGEKLKPIIKDIDQLIFDESKLSTESVSLVENFCRNIYKST